jgi:hypothetical protein
MTVEICAPLVGMIFQLAEKAQIVARMLMMRPNASPLKMNFIAYEYSKQSSEKRRHFEPARTLPSHRPKISRCTRNDTLRS